MKAADDIGVVAVLGSGTMGHGIAQVCALAGMEVRLHDISASALEKALESIAASLERAVRKGRVEEERARAARAAVRPETELAEACRDADLVVEAVPESLELKQELFRRVEGLVPETTLVASNTSSLSIEALATALRHRNRFLGLHFFNPVPVMPLLEIVRGGETSDEAVAVARDLARRLGKEPIVVRDAPGFASSRLGIALAMEAIRMVEEGVASAADIDRAMELGYRHPMGPLRLTDLVGLDVRLGIAEYLCRALGERFRPPDLLRKMVAEGRLGKKSGRGFYEWPAGD